MPGDFSLEEMKACVEREIRMRERVYPRWVQNGKMSQNKADTEIACMKAVLRRLSSISSPTPRAAQTELAFDAGPSGDPF